MPLNKSRNKYLAIPMIFIVMFLFTIQPTTTLAKETESLNRGDETWNSGDAELNKSGETLRKEIDLDQTETDTHDLKEIGDKKGDFYDAYKEEFDEYEESALGGKVFVSLMKKYNYQEGNFDCGMTNILCHIVNVVYVAGASVVNFLLDPLSKLAIEPEKILDDGTFNKFLNSFQSFTFSLLAVFILFQIMKIYLFRMTNHSDTVSVLNEKVIKIIMAGIFLFAYTEIFQLILSIQYRVNYGIFNYFSNSNQITSDLMINFLVTPNGMIFVIIIILYAVLLAILFFQMAYTFALIGLLYVVGPVAVVTMVNDEYNMFSMWLKTIISRFLTLALQGLTVVLSFSYANKMDWIFTGDLTQSNFQKIIAVSFLVVGISLPSLLKEFGNSSGSGKGAISATSSATRMITRR